MMSCADPDKDSPRDSFMTSAEMSSEGSMYKDPADTIRVSAYTDLLETER